jgi:hypothetical protein
MALRRHDLTPANKETTVKRRIIISLGFALACGLAASAQQAQGPSFNETIEYMRGALREHDVMQHPSFYKLVGVGPGSVVLRLTADGCKLTYEAIQDHGTMRFDLSDIDTNKIRVEKIAEGTTSVSFNTRNFNKSVQNIYSPDRQESLTGGSFWMDSPEVAQSFAKALTHAAQLCGGRPSTF